MGRPSLFQDIRDEILATYQDWSKVSEELLKAAAARGTYIHDLCFSHVKKIFTFSTSPYVQSFKLWFDEYVDEVILAEDRLYDDVHRFSGQPDLICEMRDKTICTVDYKSPITEGKLWKLQLAAYLHLATKNGIQSTRTMALLLSPEGKIARAIVYPETVKDLTVFLHALGVHHYLKNGK
jgi:hypothetical protein